MTFNKKEYNKKYRTEHLEELKEYNKTYHKEYYSLLKNKLIKSIRVRASKHMNIENLSLEDIIGCSINFYINFLKFQFKEDMSEFNYGSLWEIDHIIPLSVAKDIKQALHYTNTRPCHISVNQTKHAKIDKDEITNSVVNSLLFDVFNPYLF